MTEIGFAPMQFRLSGVVALPEDGDDSTWVGWGGDTKALEELAKSILGWVRPQGVLLDRRSFRPTTRIGRVTDATTNLDLERLIDHLDDYEGPERTVTGVTLGRVRRGGDGVVSGYEIDGVIPFGDKQGVADAPSQLSC